MKRRLTDGSSYLLIDHTDSPGISADIIPAELKGRTLIAPGGIITERDIQFCSHCNTAVVLNPLRARPRGYCAKCDHYICDNPICNRECNPIKRILDSVK